MSDSSQLTALANLTATYTDSDASDDDHGDSSPSAVFGEVNAKNNSKIGVKKSLSRLVSYSYGVEDPDKEEGEEDDDESKLSLTFKKETGQQLQDENAIEEEEVSRDSIKDFTSLLMKNDGEDPILPPEPPGRCSSQLQEKIAHLYENKLREGTDMNASIQKRKTFRNPSIYEKLISFCLIDELGTNYPSQVYDPHGWKEDSFYEELAKSQKVEMDKRQKERTKVEFVSGTKKTTSNSSSSSAPTAADVPSSDDSKKRKSKWDVGATQSVSLPTSSKPLLTQPPGIVPVTTTASGTKATVISAFGTITKKAKQ